jgi:hypothetical protein
MVFTSGRLALAKRWHRIQQALEPFQQGESSLRKVLLLLPTQAVVSLMV